MGATPITPDPDDQGDPNPLDDDDGRVPNTPEPDNHIVPNASGLSTAHIWPVDHPARVSSAVGGSLSQVSFPSSGLKNGGGGLRREITEFSRASRRRLLQLLNSINKNHIKIPLFITLTYPGDYPSDPKVWKKHLAAWRRRMQRKFGRCPMIWRLEFQRRGAPHFHLLAFLDASPSSLYEFVSRSWYESCGEIAPEHLSAGTRVESLRSWRGLMSYAAKYMGKPEQFDPGSTGIGRVWGVWFKDVLPISFEVVSVSVRDAIKVRRVFRRFSGVRHWGSKRDISGLRAFISYGSTKRLLCWLGYSME